MAGGARLALYDALAELERQAVRARKAVGSESSRREAARQVERESPTSLHASQRISAWVPKRRPDNPTVPTDSSDEFIWTLVSVWSRWAGRRPDKKFWVDLIGGARAEGRVGSSHQAKREAIAVGYPPRKARAFVDRPRLRTQVEDVLSNPSGTEILTQVLSGNGGVGKSQLAAIVFRQAISGKGAWSKGRQVEMGLWVDAASRDAIVSTLTLAWSRLHATRYERTVIPEAGEIHAKAFLSYLQTTSEAWLVVLDDVDNLSVLDHLWPQGSSGRVLLTTRRKDAAMKSHGEIVEVDVFTLEESLTYLRNKLEDYPNSGVEIDGANLARDLGNLPLALAQAVAVIVDDDLDCTEYRARFADRSRALAESFPVDPRASGDDYTLALPVAWTLAADRANAHKPIGLAQRILDLAAILDSNGIPEIVFRSLAARDYVVGAGERTAQSDSGARNESARVKKALLNAAHFSLLDYDKGSTHREIRMHALVQRAVLESLPGERYAKAVLAAAEALVETWPELAVDVKLQDVLRVNANALIGFHGDLLWIGGMHRLLPLVGESLGNVGRAAAAYLYFDSLVVVSDSKLGADHQDTLMARHERARFLGRKGDQMGAREAFQDLLVTRTRVLGEEHPDTLSAAHDLARWEAQTENPSGARIRLETLVPFFGKSMALDIQRR